MEEETQKQDQPQQLTTEKKPLVFETGDRTKEQAPVVLSRTHSMWDKDMASVFLNSGYSSLEEMPESLPTSVLKENTQIFAGRQIGMMEMIKAKKEYKAKRKKMLARQAIVNEYLTKSDKEEEAFHKKGIKNIRDPWGYAKLLPGKEEKQTLLEGFHENDAAKIRATMVRTFSELRKVPHSMFKYETEDDLYENYAEKKRIIDAGWVLANGMDAYIQAGGNIDFEEYEEMMAQITFYQQLSNLYSTMNRTLFSPHALLLRDKDIKGLSSDEIDARSRQIDQNLKDHPVSQTGKERLNWMTQNYLIQMKTKADYEAGKMKNVLLSPGEDPDAYYQKIVAQSKEVTVKQWTMNLTDLVHYQEEQEKLYEELYPKEERSKLAVKQGSMGGKGLDDRVPTHTTMVELVYLQETGQTMKDIYEKKKIKDPKTNVFRLETDEEFKARAALRMEEMKKVRDRVERALHSQKGKVKEVDSTGTEVQKASPEDIQLMAPIVTQMLRGFIHQFSVSDGAALYTQFKGISKMRETKMQAKATNWGKVAGLCAVLGRYSVDLYQIAGASIDITTQAFSALSKEEIELYRKAMYFAENVSQALTNLTSVLSSAKITKVSDVTEDKVKALTDRATAKKNREDLFMSFKNVTYFLSSYGKEDKEMDLNTKPQEWKGFFASGDYASITSKYMDLQNKELLLNEITLEEERKQMAEWMRTKAIEKQNAEKAEKLDSNTLYIGKLPIPLTNDGTVAPIL